MFRKPRLGIRGCTRWIRRVGYKHPHPPDAARDDGRSGGVGPWIKATQ